MSRTRKITVQSLKYKGKERDSVIRKKYYYVAIVSEVLRDGQSEVHLNFLNVEREKMIYDSFVAFAEDWDIFPYYFEAPTMIGPPEPKLKS